MSDARGSLDGLSQDARVLWRDTDDAYEDAAHQYATTSLRERNAGRPASVVFPCTLEDIVHVIESARKRGSAIAVRSGGHAFGGCSSAGGDIVQIDTSECGPCRVWSVSHDSNGSVLTVGTGWRIGDVDANLRADYGGFRTRGSFIVHGNCADVAVGGHMHTGGVSMQSRAFGLLIDHALEFQIVTADGQVRTIRKPSAEFHSDSDHDLWFSVLGGCPGAFGVVTQVSLRLHWDRDYPESRVYMQVYPWLRGEGTSLAKALLRHAVALSDADDLSADFSLHVSMASAAPKYFSWTGVARDAAVVPFAFAKKVLHNAGSGSGVFARMAEWLASVIGRAFGLKGRENPLFEASMVPLVIVQATWSNTSGDRADYERMQVQSYFQALDEVAAPFRPRGLLWDAVHRALRVASPEHHTPISSMIEALTFFGEREFDLPFMKRNWDGGAADLAERGLPTFLAELFEPFTRSIFSGHDAPAWSGHTGVFCLGLQGGAIKQKAAASAAGHRDARVSWMSDLYYDEASVPGAATALAELVTWLEHEVVGHPKAVLSDTDLRPMFNPFDPRDADKRLAHVDFDSTWQHFLDDNAVYDRVLATKRRVDPHDVFTPHRFIVGASRKFGPSPLGSPSPSASPPERPRILAAATPASPAPLSPPAARRAFAVVLMVALYDLVVGLFLTFAPNSWAAHGPGTAWMWLDEHMAELPEEAQVVVHSMLRRIGAFSIYAGLCSAAFAFRLRAAPHDLLAFMVLYAVAGFSFFSADATFFHGTYYFVVKQIIGTVWVFAALDLWHQLRTSAPGRHQHTE